MTRTPHTPQHTPLDAQERELADRLARLPAINPPPELDARILAQARAALQNTPARRRLHRPWWMGAGFGTAAAAVLAAGAAWQAGLFHGISFGSDVPVPRSTSTPAAAPANDTSSLIAIDLEHSAKPTHTPPEPLEAASADAPPPAPAAPPPPAPAVAPAPVPPPPAPATATRQRSAVLEQNRAKTTEKNALLIEELQRNMPVASSPSLPDNALPAANIHIRPDTSQVLPHWYEDEKLTPDQWLECIRERIRRGDRNSAALSLRRFTLKHPGHSIPEELTPLLAGRP